MKSPAGRLCGLIGVAALLAGAACAPGARHPDDGAAVTFPATELLGRPTESSVTLTLSADADLEAQVQWGTSSGVYSAETATSVVRAGEPWLAILSGLEPDRRHFYRVRYRRPGETVFAVRDEGCFYTQRAPGSTFTFTVQADSHLDENSNLDLYRRTLANVRADSPDFHIDLGDTFMCDKHSGPLTPTVRPASDQATVRARYLNERAHFGLIGRTVPLFLVNGNHEGEWGWLLDGTSENLPIWATKARQLLYLNPVPDGFYGGDPVEEPFVGRRASRYAWQWGDAQFIALDAFWNSEKPGSDGWNLTLGEGQYRWLAEVLSQSRATFKFIFIHNLVGGLDGQMRGGVEAAPYFEWGGRNADGTAGFDGRRPGWGTPIHDLLVRSGVTAVFHGHDHLYARQDLGGVVYQEVPQPSTTNFSSGPSLAAAYHYLSGTIAGSSGHLRITVGPSQARVEYVRAFRPEDETAFRRNRTVADSYVLTAR